MQSKETEQKSCCGPTCCGGEAATDVREKVREGYAAIANRGVFSETPSGECRGGGGCCGDVELDENAFAAAIGYSQADLSAVPDSANMGLSCGNPTAIATLRPGEVVLDLGSGGGFDAFIAGPKVGQTGRVIGVDMTPEMIAKARRNTSTYVNRTGLQNVEFRLGEIEHLPVADRSIDVVISNCVLNLSPDKPQVWREIARVLKPGGRVAVSDLALLKPLPREVLDMVEALIGCVAGAALVSDIEKMMREAGLTEIRLTPKPHYIEAMTNGNDPLYRRVADTLPKGTTAADFITSLDITATSPARS